MYISGTLKRFKISQWSLNHKFSFSLFTILIAILTIFLRLIKCKSSFGSSYKIV